MVLYCLSCEFFGSDFLVWQYCFLDVLCLYCYWFCEFLINYFNGVCGFVFNIGVFDMVGKFCKVS